MQIAKKGGDWVSRLETLRNIGSTWLVGAMKTISKKLQRCVSMCGFDKMRKAKKASVSEKKNVSATARCVKRLKRLKTQKSQNWIECFVTRILLLVRLSESKELVPPSSSTATLGRTSPHHVHCHFRFMLYFFLWNLCLTSPHDFSTSSERLCPSVVVGVVIVAYRGIYWACWAWKWRHC